jgi:hypothetical protein
MNIKAMIFLPLLSILIHNANGLLVPKIYGHVDPQKCVFISETREQHQIYKFGNFFIFGRVYLLDKQNTKMLGNPNNWPRMKILENFKSSAKDRMEFTKAQVFQWKLTVLFDKVLILEICWSRH